MKFQKGMKLQKNILLLRSSVGVYGAERVILELAKGLTDKSANVTIGVVQNKHTASTELASAAAALGLNSVVFDGRQPFDPLTAYNIHRFIKNNDISIVNSHGYKADFYALMSTLFNNVPCLATCHPWPGSDDSVKAKFYTSLDMRLLKRFPRIVAISEEIEKEVLAAGFSKNKITVIENGIDISRFENNNGANRIRKDLRIPAGVNIIGTIGRLSPEKGQLDFLEAAKLLTESFDDVFFVIVGTGPMREILEAAIKELGLHNNVLMTAVRSDIPQLLSIFDIFVLPSHSEGLPMALLEAMASKKPIVATRVGAIPNLLSHGKSGLLVPARKVNDLRDVITALLRNPIKAKSIAQEAYTTVVGRYSAARMTKQYLDVYQQMLI